MMANLDLIDRQALIANLNRFAPERYNALINSLITKEPTIDPESLRPQGEWIKHGYKWKCTHCGVLMNIDGTPDENLLHYCPNCGAKMKGAGDNA